LVLIGAKVVALIMPIGAIIVMNTIEIVVRIVMRVVDKFTNTLTSLTLYSMVRIRIDYTSV
jgi:hypothetical protein